MSDRGRAPNISWSQFEVCNPDTRTAFEKMCGFLFNVFFFEGKEIFHSDPNNPGVEIIPVLDKKTGKRISYQAKYFTNIDYLQIKHSVEKAIQNYAGKLDVLYLYCNKDLTTSSKSYQSICGQLNLQNISLVPITNQAILDQVLNNSIVAWYYFDYHCLNSAWFEERLQLSLSALGPRYNRNFNVNTGTEKQFDTFLCSNSAVAQINKAKRELAEQLKTVRDEYSDCKETISKIINAILSIDDVTRATITDCLSWHDIISKQCADDFSLIKGLITKKKDLYDAEKESDNYNQRSNLLKEIHDLEKLLKLPDYIGLDQSDCALLKNKVLIVKGDAGAGKSQLFANAAEKLNKEGQHALLMLGNCFLSTEPVSSQIAQQLGLDLNFKALLYKLEMLGAQENCNVCLLIDAINETPYREIWKVGLPSLIFLIKKLEHLKIAISVRSGYEKQVFNDAISEAIETRTISCIVHSGFREESVEATSAFLNYYNISFLPSYFLQEEMTNPLFLTLFCKYYTGEIFDMFTFFNMLIDRADEEAQKAVGYTDNLHILQELIKELANLRLANDNWSITKEDLFGLNFWNTYGLSSKKIPFVAALERSGFLNSVIISETEYYYLGYNLLEDFVCAKNILNRYQNKSQLIIFIKNNLLKIENGQIIRYSNIDIFIVICSLYAEYYHEECFVSISELVTDAVDYNDISQRYIKSFLWRKASAVNERDFLEYIREHCVPRADFFQVLIENSTKENHPLNAFLLHRILINKTLAQRDYLWTTFINGLANFEERLFQLINYVGKGNFLKGMSESNTELLLILFTWLLTSSNRILRDKASKASIELLKNNFSLCKPLLQRFEKVDDPYVIQRLFGIIFGACVKRCKPSIDIYRELAEYIYNLVFNQDNVYPDILLRDYARLILERWMYEAPHDCSFIDAAKIKPPYKSEKIPCVVKQKYYNWESIHSGFNSIDRSMRINHSECPDSYGDFGRYTFQAALNSFAKVDVVNLYHYAMQYIRDTLGYSDLLFSDYDCFMVHYSPGRYFNKKTERIGKKYQWIAFYNILARVSDTHQLKDGMGAFRPYEGAWEPYVRDFDPTLNVNFLKPESLPAIQYSQLVDELFLQTDPFPSEAEVKNWVRNTTIFYKNLPDKLMLVDKDGTQWVNLNLHDNVNNERFENDSMNFAKGTQEIWLNAHGYFVDPEAFEILKRQFATGLSATNFPRGLEVYQIYNRKYSWSPGYQSIFQQCCFETKIQKIVPTNETSVKVLPAYSHLLWENEYDASQKNATSFDVPCREIIEYLHLEQKENDGYYFNSDGVLVCFDASLSGICDGLLARKEYLDQFIAATGMKLFWLCTGEKQFFQGEVSQSWQRWKGFIYYKQGQISVDHECEDD